MKDVPHDYLKIIGDLVAQGYYLKPTGSRETKSGFTSTSDYDFVVLDPKKTLAHSLEKSPTWQVGGSGNGSEFISFKLHDSMFQCLNLILVDSKDIFNKWVAATELIRVMDTKDKHDRIRVFESVFGRSEEGLPF